MMIVYDDIDKYFFWYYIPFHIGLHYTVRWLDPAWVLCRNVSFGQRCFQPTDCIHLSFYDGVDVLDLPQPAHQPYYEKHKKIINILVESIL